jgi:hypothetical protein
VRIFRRPLLLRVEFLEAGHALHEAGTRRAEARRSYGDGQACSFWSGAVDGGDLRGDWVHGTGERVDAWTAVWFGYAWEAKRGF